MNEIRNRRLDRFQDIDSTSLALYKVAFIADSVIINTLKNNNVFTVQGAERRNHKTQFLVISPIVYSGEKETNVIVYPRR
jgi:hypothetical protein